MNKKWQKEVIKSHIQSGGLSLKNKEYVRQLKEYFTDSLINDLGGGSDVTSKILFNKSDNSTAVIICKSPGILCGIEELDFLITIFRPLIKDGQKIKKNQTVALIKGNTNEILKIERTVLNFIQRMSGIASSMNEYARLAPNVLITPTRKTILGILDKKPCITGGGGTHRLTMDDGILIKDNHLNALKDPDKIIDRLRAGIGKHKNAKFLEIEVNSVTEAVKYAKILNKVSSRLPNFLMFDNMKPSAIKNAITKIHSSHFGIKIFFEASGGINKKNIKHYAATGVHVISIGEITHSVKGLDFSLEIID